MAFKEKKLTKRERKAAERSAAPVRRAATPHHQHIHCIACGRHMEASEFEGMLPLGRMIVCDHGSEFPACAKCESRAREIVAEHDRTGEPVKIASAWH